MSKDNKYFSKFPYISYNGANCVNILERTAFLESVFKNPYIYYPYDIEGEERADQFANRYYGDPYKSWLFYITNNIMDPLRQWYLSQKDFNEFLTEKYGSVQIAHEKIKFWRNDWENSESLTPSGYDALPSMLQQYWEPVLTGNKITSYQRRRIDWTINTNRIVAYAVANTNFIKDERVQILFNPRAGGTGQVLSVDTNNHILYLQHVQGTYLESLSFIQTENQDNILTESGSYLLTDSGMYIYGTESQVNTVMTALPKSMFGQPNLLFGQTGQDFGFVATYVISENLTPAEEAYWTPVTYFDFENEGNEYNKTIRVLDKRYAGTVVQNLEDLMTI